MHKPKSNLKNIIFRIIISISIVVMAVFITFKCTPWPAALLIRYAFEKDAQHTNQALEKHVPTGVSMIPDLQYDVEDKDAHLDIYYPVKINNNNLPLVVWVHGGGWISGNKGQTSNYYKILAAQGYIVAAIDYSIAPEKKYPIPIKQTLVALKYLQDNANKFHINSSSIFLAGDSAGAHIVAQVANIISEPSYAELMQISPSIERSTLKGLLLYCGAYDAENINLDGVFGSFLNTVLWSYSGKKDFITDADFKAASVINFIDKNFPSSFISAGNDDPLRIHSQKLARKLQALHVQTDTLFFPENLTPKLPHEYQFNLDVEAGRTALNRSIQFLRNNQ